MTNHDALLERLDYCGGRRGDGPDTNAWLEAATAIREQAKEIERECAARDEFQERNRKQANIIKSLREQLEAARTMLRAASTELRKLKMTATADCIDAAIAAGVGK